MTNPTSPTSPTSPTNPTNPTTTSETTPAGVTILGEGGLSLRPLDVDRDLEVLHTIFGEPSQMLYMSSAAMASVAETRAQLLEWCTSEDSPQWAITADGEQACGRITLIARREGVMEIGVQVAPGCQRQGLARRAIVAVTEYALGTLELGRVFADIDPDNTPCVRAFERAGFRREGRLVANWLTHTGFADSLIYAATRGWSATEATEAT